MLVFRLLKVTKIQKANKKTALKAVKLLTILSTYKSAYLRMLLTTLSLGFNLKRFNAFEYLFQIIFNDLLL